MNSSTEAKAQQILAPECRGGTTTTVIERTTKPKPSVSPSSYIERVLTNLRYDKNLIYLAARLQNYSELTDARMISLRQAITESDAAGIADLAQALTDSTAKLGAIRMMKLCIALQMLGRRGLIEKAGLVLAELEAEYDRFKQTLISAVG